MHSGEWPLPGFGVGSGRRSVTKLRTQHRQIPMITKSITRLVALLAMLSLSTSHSFAAEKPEEQAQAAAEQWLALIDAEIGRASCRERVL